MSSSTLIRWGNGALAACALLSFCAAEARADTNKVLADSLFDQGKALMAKGQYAQACAKFAESQRLDPSGGTIQHLAMCREGEGKTATAYAGFKDCISQARRDGRKDREDFCAQRVAALEPKLSKLTIKVAPTLKNVSGLRVTLDGVEVPAAAWDDPFPVDPGDRTVFASAAGSRGFEKKVTIGKEADTQTVVIESIDGASVAPTSNAPAHKDAPSGARNDATPDARGAATGGSGGGGRRALAFTALGVGVVALGAGTFFGIQTFSNVSKSDENCPGGACNQAGVDAMNSAKMTANFANVLVPVGVVGIGLGAVLLLTVPSSKADAGAVRPPTRRAAAHRVRRSVSLSPLVGLGLGGLSAHGRF